MTFENFQEFLEKNNLSEEEYNSLKERISRLRIDQIAALIELVGIHFRREDIEKVAKSIKEDKDEADIIIDEANSLEKLKFWLEFFEKYRK